MLIFIASAGCGKRKNPLPPIEKVQQRVEISGFQQGNKVNLSWTLPVAAAQNASDTSVSSIKQVDVYRLAEPLDAPASLTEEDFASRSTLIGSVTISDEDRARRQITYTDSLEFAGQAVKLRYAIRFVNAAGQKAGFSNFLLIEPTARVAAAPSLASPGVTQDAILLRWQPPTANVDGSKPVNVLGYNVYRAEMETTQAQPGKMLNTVPVTRSEFSDRAFEFERSYRYFVRAVSLGANGQPIESASSNAVEIVPKDTFPPSAPSALTIAATPDTISIFFAANLENDVAGYRVFRSTNPDLPKPEWQNLTPNLLTTNTFQDTKIEPGKTYYYYLTAVDKFGNTSESSEVVGETVP
ncbi:MAG: fibronectin type III domain-containing protein [Acidobacteriota bacterium]|nr:fibronectin type III domain-containing protein [Acidobacteriota bacterium]